jgi:hypothetical protein
MAPPGKRIQVSFLSNFGEKRMAKSAKLPANSSKLLLAYSINFVRILFKNVWWNGFLCHSREKRKSGA